MNPNEPKWYGRLRRGPFQQERQPAPSHVQAIIDKVTKGRKERRMWKLSAAAVFIVVFVLITVWLLSTLDRTTSVTTSERHDVFAGIERTDIPDFATDPNIEVMREYKGNNDRWAAEYYIYRTKDDNDRQIRCYAKYIGDGPSPTGEVRYTLKSEDTIYGSATMSYGSPPEQGIYNLSFGKIADLPDRATLQLLMQSPNDTQFEWVTLNPVEQ
ncbi:hypothetical protein GZH47_24950 [Paenibacillus rhizovicinus]|uniref:Uncharacterized protein n=1 Tax=Paenibacillus rhizovicinus TaxID=2704463 RepID=A0A6C0P599_9BACL|nr:hypothetical protein [Paenibacillus rhizovicinus]QHW33724.1 hypothetical protein GZH47_24950 [Paenibacillus rhizovicinus]